jgi:hypothetical protein
MEADQPEQVARAPAEKIEIFEEAKNGEVNGDRPEQDPFTVSGRLGPEDPMGGEEFVDQRDKKEKQEAPVPRTIKHEAGKQ